MHDADRAIETLLARLFTDSEFRDRFRRDPQAVGRAFGLDDAAIASFKDADWVGLDLAARSYARKRGQPPFRRDSGSDERAAPFASPESN